MKTMVITTLIILVVMAISVAATDYMERKADLRDAVTDYLETHTIAELETALEQSCLGVEPNNFNNVKAFSGGSSWWGPLLIKQCTKYVEYTTTYKSRTRKRNICVESVYKPARATHCRGQIENAPHYKTLFYVKYAIDGSIAKTWGNNKFNNGFKFPTLV